MAKNTLRRDGYFATYFHPWEFGEIREFKEVPGYIKMNSGEKFSVRLEKVIQELKQEGEFLTCREAVNNVLNLYCSSENI